MEITPKLSLVRGRNNTNGFWTAFVGLFSLFLSHFTAKYCLPKKLKSKEKERDSAFSLNKLNKAHKGRGMEEKVEERDQSIKARMMWQAVSSLSQAGVSAWTVVGGFCSLWLMDGARVSFSLVSAVPGQRTAAAVCSFWQGHFMMMIYLLLIC